MGASKRAGSFLESWDRNAGRTSRRRAVYRISPHTADVKNSKLFLVRFGSIPRGQPAGLVCSEVTTKPTPTVILSKCGM